MMRRVSEQPTPLTTLPRYLAAVLEFSIEDNVVFRGHRCSSWSLQPKLARLSLRSDKGVRQTEANLVEAFKSRCLPYIDRDLADQWDLLAMAQHHGLATRLLDWTQNPLVALWFCVRDPAISDEGSVLAFAPEEQDFADKAISPFQVSKTMFFRPSHLNSRIVAQSGWFSIHRLSTKTAQFSTLERVARYKERVETLLIPSDAFADLRSELDRVGINEATLFPDLDGLTGYLTWLHSLLHDETLREKTS